MSALMTRETPLPRALASRSVRVLRPRDATDTYKDPFADLRRLADAGLLIRLAHGYYAIPPTEAFGDPAWQPTPEGVALGIGVADYGENAAALSGVSAARVRGVLARAVAVAIVSIPTRRQTLDTTAGRIVFWTRDTGTLDLQRAKTDLAPGYATSLEQTVLDIADRPRLGGVSTRLASETLWQLARRTDWDLVYSLSVAQRRPAAYARARWVCAGVAPDDAPPPRPRRSTTTTLGLISSTAAEPSLFGLIDDRS